MTAVDAGTEGDADYALRGLWYYAAPSRALPAGRLLARTILGEAVVLGRDGAGAPFALEDVCPHRGIPLHHGRLLGEGGSRALQCCYHGWRFAPDGRLVHVPSLVEGQPFDMGRVRVRAWPVREADGNIWIFMGEGRGPWTPEGDIPRLPDLGGHNIHRIFETQSFPCPLDHAVMGLMDPAHGPFVHASWWWRPARSAHVKEKRFAPSELGFTMLRHRPSSNSRAYRLLGGVPETEIAFRLPGVRIEHIRAGRHQVVSLTALTPVGPSETLVHQAVYWTLPWAAALKPVLAHYVRAFLAQDRDIVAKQQEGLARHPPMRLIDDADTPAKWYLRLKREFARARAEGRPFRNPVPEATLRWRS